MASEGFPPSLTFKSSPCLPMIPHFPSLLLSSCFSKRPSGLLSRRGFLSLFTFHTPASSAHSLAQFHTKADALNPRSWMSFFTPDAILNYANGPTLTGHESIVAAMEQSMSGLQSMKHEYAFLVAFPPHNPHFSCTISILDVLFHCSLPERPQ